MSVLHAESTRDRSQLFESQSFIKMTGMSVAFDYCVELQYFETECRTLFDAVFY